MEGSVTEESDLHCSDERPFYRRAAGPPAGHRSWERVPTERLELPRTQALDLLRLPLSPRRQIRARWRGARELFSEVVIARGTVKSRHCPYSTA